MSRKAKAAGAEGAIPQEQPAGEAYIGALANWGEAERIRRHYEHRRANPDPQERKLLKAVAAALTEQGAREWFTEAIRKTIPRLLEELGAEKAAKWLLGPADPLGEPFTDAHRAVVVGAFWEAFVPHHGLPGLCPAEWRPAEFPEPQTEEETAAHWAEFKRRLVSAEFRRWSAFDDMAGKFYQGSPEGALDRVGYYVKDLAAARPWARTAGGAALDEAAPPTPDEQDDKLSPARAKAQAIYNYAMEKIPGARRMFYNDLHAAIQKMLTAKAAEADGSEVKKWADFRNSFPQSPETFARYLRDAGIKRYGRSKDREPGRGICRRGQL